MEPTLEDLALEAAMVLEKFDRICNDANAIRVADQTAFALRKRVESLRSRAAPQGDALETQGFYDLMQSYRHTSAIDQAKVCERFEAIKAFLRASFAAPVTAPVSTGDKARYESAHPVLWFLALKSHWFDNQYVLRDA